MTAQFSPPFPLPMYMCQNYWCCTCGGGVLGSGKGTFVLLCAGNPPSLLGSAPVNLLHGPMSEDQSENQDQYHLTDDTATEPATFLVPISRLHPNAVKFNLSCWLTWVSWFLATHYWAVGEDFTIYHH